METVARVRDMSFRYAAESEDDATQVFEGVDAELPGGLISVVGQNGFGKSTLLLLVGGRIFPSSGSITIFGTDTQVFLDAEQNEETEAERNRLVSFIYQNMEFESRESVGDLMEFVYENGFHETKSEELVRRIRTELELDGFLGKRTQQLAKGQLQRAIIGFGLLYGSRLIIMDEPVFALEEPQKDRAFAFLREFSGEYSVPIYFSVHNLDLSRRFSDHTVLFTGHGEFVVGSTDTVLTRERVEDAYSAPIDTLYERDKLYRQVLVRQTELS